MKPNMMAMFREFMKDPIGNLSKSGINIPNNIRNDPNAIVQYMLSNRNMTQQQYNFLQPIANDPKKWQ